MVQTRFQLISDKFNKAQAEQNRELERERKKLMAQNKQSDDDDDLSLKPPCEKSNNLLKKLIKLFNSEKS